MNVPELTLRRLARAAAALAGAIGLYHVLYLLGAFGSVTCWQGTSESGSASSNGTVTTTEPTVTRGCESGIDFLLGSTGGNAEVLFSWALVLLALVAVGSSSAWTGHRYITWASVGCGAVITVIGVLSIGWFFLLPTVCLLVAATALSVEARRT